MWNVNDDLTQVDDQFDDYSKDVCCNTHAYFSIRTEPSSSESRDAHRVLDITVCNRSNDMILGMLGANVVQFSMLQEYMAAHIGVGIGKYHQITNNLHVYANNWKPTKWLEACDSCPYPRVESLAQGFSHFDSEVRQFIDEPLGPIYANTFLQKTAAEVVRAFKFHKERDYDAAIEAATRIEAEDWRFACSEWIIRRRVRYNQRQQKEKTNE
jgi:hypothetical protein